MAQNDIQGQVLDASGNPVEGAIVELTKSYQSSPTDEQVVRRTTTDNNGNYTFSYHPDGDGSTQEWHVSCYNYDGTAYVNSENNPGVTADLSASAIPDSGVSRWTFDNADTSGTTATDIWGDNNGTIDGALTGETGLATYDSGESYAFDGSDDSVGLPSGIVGGSTDFSFAFWFNGDVLQTGGESEDRLFSLRGDTTLFVEVGRNGEDTLGVWTGSDNSISTITAGTTYQLTVTIENSTSTVKAYLNDTLELDTTQDTSSDSSDSYIGGNDAGGSGRYFDGRIDDPRVYSKVLSATEASNLYQTGSIDG